MKISNIQAVCKNCNAPVPNLGEFFGYCSFACLQASGYFAGTEDPVNHPKHYTSHPSGVECITITRHMSFNLGNVFKYLWRAGIKNSELTVQDLEKAEFYLKDEIALMKATLEKVS